jgi:hypothetical protein
MVIRLELKASLKRRILDFLTVSKVRKGNLVNMKTRMKFLQTFQIPEDLEKGVIVMKSLQNKLKRMRQAGMDIDKIRVITEAPELVYPRAIVEERMSLDQKEVKDQASDSRSHNNKGGNNNG